MTDLVPLDDAESVRLADCERKIRDGLQTFVEVGRALADIRDGRLYRQTHTTFEAYCEQEYSLSGRRAYQLIDAAGVVEAVRTIVQTPVPATESQARELAGLKPGVAAEVMQSAAEQAPKITAAAIRAAREQVAPRPQPVKVVETETLTTESWVQPDTGEVVEQPPAVVEQDPLGGYLADDEGMKRANYQAALARAIKAAGDLTKFAPADVARLADQQQVDSLNALMPSLNNFAATVRKLRGNVLRLVETR